MSRARKLVLVSIVLAVGVALAWPFRKTGQESYSTSPELSPATSSTASQLGSLPLPARANPAQSSLGKQTIAHMASTADPVENTASGTGFDIENHPALAQHKSETPRQSEPPSPAVPKSLPASSQPTSLGDARPAYATILPTPSSDAAWPEEVLHVVTNGDTLEKLAEHYLGDEGRALELFDLNREQLANPHLLPIGAKLRIPVAPDRDVD